eukprot:scaffold100295_cov60-Attheya_sp.AAC.1
MRLEDLTHIVELEHIILRGLYEITGIEGDSFCPVGDHPSIRPFGFSFVIETSPDPKNGGYNHCSENLY